MSDINLGAVVLDCPDPRALAEFYHGLLGGEVTGDGEGEDWVDLTVDGHRLSFQRARNHQPPSWPDGPPQQFHLDLTVEEYAGPHALVTSLGAVPLDPVDPPPAEDGRTWRVYADPAGHPFCLCMC
jgi:catechol-2,3-dioxygenase